jgi:signal transduction histidine kinase/DNA-binding XRE family transcriptional regulator
VSRAGRELLSAQELAGALINCLLDELIDPADSEVQATVQVERRLASVRQQLRQTDRELGVLRWLAPILAGDPPEHVQLPRLKSAPLAALVATLQSPSGLLSGVRLDLPAFLQVQAAPGAVRTVLRCLLHNAAVHAQGAEVCIKAQTLLAPEQPWPRDLAPRSPGPFVLITVVDNGPGVAPWQHEDLFEKHWTAAQGQPWLSKSLWLCRHILRAHGGEIWLNPGAPGTCFLSAWPLRRPEPPQRLREPTPRRPERPADPGLADPKRFGQRFRQAREQAGLTRFQLAYLAGVADSSIRNVETARHRTRPGIRAQLVTALQAHAQRSGLPVPFEDDDEDD